MPKKKIGGKNRFSDADRRQESRWNVHYNGLENSVSVISYNKILTFL